MLRLLQGRRHHVCTGVALWRLGAIRDAVEATAVDFAPMTAEEIEWYVASGEPLGKAGAYAIQGLASRFVSRIEGSYSNVVGLPIALVHRLLSTSRVTDHADEARTDHAHDGDAARAADSADSDLKRCPWPRACDAPWLA